jgi:hypothetical protein
MVTRDDPWRLRDFLADVIQQSDEAAEDFEKFQRQREARINKAHRRDDLVFKTHESPPPAEAPAVNLDDWFEDKMEIIGSETYGVVQMLADKVKVRLAEMNEQHEKEISELQGQINMLRSLLTGDVVALPKRKSDAA